MSIKKKKVLILAYACEPNRTSEPGVGWFFSHKIAEFMDVTVLTRANNKAVIEKEDNELNIKYIYCDLPKFFMKLKKVIPLGTQIYFVLWQWKAYFKIRFILKKKDFDLVHHLTFGMTKNPPHPYLFKVPFIWGPIGGGGGVIPKKFFKGMSFSAKLREFLYYLIGKMGNISPRSYFTRKNTKAIIFRGISAINSFPKNGCINRYVISETAMPKIPQEKQIKEVNNVLDIMCLGRIMPHKNYFLGLQAFHVFLKLGGKGSLTFCGNGPEEEKLKEYVKRHSIKEFVEFKGHVNSKIVNEYLIKSHVLLHPSFREGGSWAIMESMSYGLPVVCLNTGGQRDMVTDNCGLLIDLHTPQLVSKDISLALLQLLNDKELYKDLSRKAQIRIAEEYNWDKRKEQIKKVYEEVLSEKL